MPVYKIIVILSPFNHPGDALQRTQTVMLKSQEPNGAWISIRNTSVAGYSLTRPIPVNICLILWLTPLSGQELPSWLKLLRTGHTLPALSSTLFILITAPVYPPSLQSPVLTFPLVQTSSVMPQVYPFPLLCVAISNLTNGYDFLVARFPPLK